MWDRAPGPLPAESEMEEGGEEEGSERKEAAAARTGQVRLGFRLARRRPGRPLSMSVSPFHGEENRDSQVLPHVALH